MYNIVKKLPIVMVLLLVASCGRVQMDSVDKSYSTETITVEAKIPQITGLSSQSLSESVNREYERTITGLLEDFKKQAGKTGDQSAFSVTTTEHYNSGNFFSSVTQVEAVVGSLRKSLVRITKNIDTKKCAEVSFSDLFEGDSYIDMINARLSEAVKNDSERYRGIWEKPTLSENQKFYITDNCVVLYYDPYKLSYYERGFVEIPLSLSDMSGYLKEEYRYLGE